MNIYNSTGDFDAPISSNVAAWVNTHLAPSLNSLRNLFLNLVIRKQSLKELLNTNNIHLDLRLAENEVHEIFSKLSSIMNKYHHESSESSLKILVALYHGLKRMIPNSKIILSKGHASIAFYSVLYSNGVLNENDIKEFGGPLSKLQAHPEAFRVPEAIVSTGSLGQGLSVGVGLALGMKMRNENGIVAVVVGDGELDEGIVWESIATASAKSLDNLVIIVDRNRSQLSGDTEDIKPKEPLVDRFRSFGLCANEIKGSSAQSIFDALAKLINKCKGPKALIVNT